MCKVEFCYKYLHRYTVYIINREMHDESECLVSNSTSLKVTEATRENQFNHANCSSGISDIALCYATPTIVVAVLVNSGSAFIIKSFYGYRIWTDIYDLSTLTSKFKVLWDMKKWEVTISQWSTSGPLPTFLLMERCIVQLWPVYCIASFYETVDLYWA